MRRVALVIVAGLTVLGLASCGDDTSPPGSSALSPAVPVSAATVKITRDGFAPDSVTVPAGDAVTFRNDDDQDHRVKADDGSFDTGVLHANESTVVLFTDPGTVKYSDSLDPSRTGQVEVAASTP